MNNNLWDVLFVFSKAERIRNDEEKREKSVRFAVESIIMSVFMAALLGVGAFLLSLDGFTVIIGIIVIICALSLFVTSLVRVIAQFTINRRPITWVALAVFLAAIIIPAVAVVCLIFLS